MDETVDIHGEAEQRYREACERRQQTIDAWIDLGRPLTTAGSTGQTRDHPLVRQINELDKLCNTLGDAVRKKVSGPNPVAVVQASVGKSPAAKIRARGRGQLRAVAGGDE